MALNKEGKIEDHPIVKIINCFLHSVRDIEAAAKNFIPLSQLWLMMSFMDAGDDLEKTKGKIKAKNESNRCGREIKNIYEAVELLDRIEKSNMPEALTNSLFLGLFSAFDTFKGNLLFFILKRKPVLLNALESEVNLREIFTFNKISLLKDSLIKDEIEKLGRESYIDQFRKLECWFDLKMRKFNH